MANNLPANPKLLKIFTPVRCLNRDQLPRYIEGKLTDLEKHLVEQHLVDCDLCNEALHVLENDTHRSRYSTLVAQLHQYIRVNIKPESQVKKKETAIRKERNRESLLAVFWIFAFVIIIAGSVYVYKGFINGQTSTPALPANRVVADIPANTPEDLAHPTERHGDTIVQGTPVPQNLLASNAPITTTSATAATASLPHDSTKVIPAVLLKKDSIKVPVRKPDSTAKAATAPAAKIPDTVKKAPPAKPEATATPKEKQEKPVEQAAKKDEEKKPEPIKKKAEDDNKKEDKKVEVVKKKEEEKKPEPAKKKEEEKSPSLDEFMYKAARVSQQDGDYNEAISRYRNLASTSSPKYTEMAKYQIAQCYKAQGHHGKAKRMFKEVIKMNGSLKNAAQQALDADKSTEE